MMLYRRIIPRHALLLITVPILLSALVLGTTGCEAPRGAATSSVPHRAPANTAQSSEPQPKAAPAPQALPSDSARWAPVGLTQRAELRPKPGGVTDGDTIKVVGFAKSLRLINIDTEEVFRDRNDEAKAAQNWETYLAEHSDPDDYKTFATPMGEKATSFARAFFRDVESVTLEYQSPTYTRGFFDRHLVMAWVPADKVPSRLIPGAPAGAWVNYNVEVVRAGMSAYYSKYGYNMRLHEAFRQAEREAKEHQRGIWAPGAQSYQDYDGRIAWWNEKADQIQKFRAYARAHPATIDLASDIAYARLRQKIGQRVVVFGAPKSFAKNSDPQRVRLTYRYRRDLPVVAFKPVDMRQSGVQPRKEHYIYVEGIVGMYRGDPEIRYDAQSWMRPGSQPPDR